MRAFLLFLCIPALLSRATAFIMPAAPHRLHASTSAFAPRATLAAPASEARIRQADLRMGKVSKFGLFSPAVIAAKVVLGEARLNKIRGKAIALHSQAITEYCNWVGASSSMRGQLIKKAKTNGDTLGFLW